MSESELKQIFETILEKLEEIMELLENSVSSAGNYQ